MIVFDSAKNLANLAKHGIELSSFHGFDSLPAVEEDSRSNYGETRFRAFGRIRGLGYCLVYVPRGPDTRLISFRRAHEKEMQRNGR